MNVLKLTHNLQVSNFADAVTFLKKNGGTVRYWLPESRISVKLVELEKLDGSNGVFVKQVGDGSMPLQNVEEPYILNSGELSDSLVFEGCCFSLTKNIVPLFKQQYKHKLLIRNYRH